VGGAALAKIADYRRSLMQRPHYLAPNAPAASLKCAWAARAAAGACLRGCGAKATGGDGRCHLNVIAACLLGRQLAAACSSV